MKIYVASSWRNHMQPGMVHVLRGEGHEVYDFRNPAPGERGFSWSEIDVNWRDWSNKEFIEGLHHPLAEHGYKRDMDAMEWADVGVLLMSAGFSAHLETGWFAGNPNKRCIILLAMDYDDNEAQEFLTEVVGHSLSDAECVHCVTGDLLGCRLKDNYNDTGYRRRMEAVKHRPLEPELMYKMADCIVTTVTEVLITLEAFQIDDETQEDPCG